VDQFFAARDQVHFHSLVVDTTKQKHEIYNQGRKEIGFNKEVFQLALKMARLYTKALFHVYPDRRSTDQKLDDLRLMLNRHRAKSGDKRDWPYRRVQFRDSKKTELLQLADIMAGAIAHQLNGHHLRAGASPAKRTLSEHILARAGAFRPLDPTRDTAIGGKFTIWHRRLK
jgi:hypothetical protein